MQLDVPPAAPAEVEPPPTATRTRWQEWGGAIRELVETLVLTLVIFLLIRFAAPNFRIEGSSMEPNFHDGEHLFVNRLAYMFGVPERGDVIVFIPPSSLTRDYIKRVIGLPGDRVEIVDGTVYINGNALDEPYPLNRGSSSYGPITVGPNEYFVLGDNRDNSSDSRSWGLLARDKIIGKAWITYWPPDMAGLVPGYSYNTDR
ncbi:MAG: signal peptidase I [Chloroflexi bacterium]|nr:signal peptidase I [Chloroflexota bacterium]